MANGNTIHGFKPKSGAHPFYRSWRHMMSRCMNPNVPSWPYYGGRGITVCERWKTFTNFRDDMFFSWKKGLTIERVDNSKGYSKENCVWADQKTQNRNKRNVKPISFGGESLFAIDWAKRLGGNPDLIYVRLGRGWSVERAVTTPVCAP